MPQKTKGGRRFIEDFSEALDAIEAASREGEKLAIYNPQFSQRQHIKIRGLAERLRYILREAEPLLERQAPQYEQRLGELEQQVAELAQWRERVEAERVIPFRKAE